MKGYIKNFWIKHTIKYYLVMLVCSYFLVKYFNHTIPLNGFYLFPNDLLGTGASFGGLFDLTLFKFLAYNIFFGFLSIMVFVSIFIFLGGDFSSTKNNERKAYSFFISKRNKQTKKWMLINIFYLYSIPILAINTIVLIFK